MHPVADQISVVFWGQRRHPGVLGAGQAASGLQRLGGDDHVRGGGLPGPGGGTVHASAQAGASGSRRAAAACTHAAARPAHAGLRGHRVARPATLQRAKPDDGANQDHQTPCVHVSECRCRPSSGSLAGEVQEARHDQAGRPSKKHHSTAQGMLRCKQGGHCLCAPHGRRLFHSRRPCACAVTAGATPGSTQACRPRQPASASRPCLTPRHVRHTLYCLPAGTTACMPSSRRGSTPPGTIQT